MCGLLADPVLLGRRASYHCCCSAAPMTVVERCPTPSPNDRALWATRPKYSRPPSAVWSTGPLSVFSVAAPPPGFYPCVWLGGRTLVAVEVACWVRGLERSDLASWGAPTPKPQEPKNHCGDPRGALPATTAGGWFRPHLRTGGLAQATLGGGGCGQPPPPPALPHGGGWCTRCAKGQHPPSPVGMRCGVALPPAVEAKRRAHHGPARAGIWSRPGGTCAPRRPMRPSSSLQHTHARAHMLVPPSRPCSCRPRARPRAAPALVPTALPHPASSHSLRPCPPRSRTRPRPLPCSLAPSGARACRLALSTPPLCSTIRSVRAPARARRAVLLRADCQRRRCGGRPPPRSPARPRPSWTRPLPSWTTSMTSPTPRPAAVVVLPPRP